MSLTVTVDEKQGIGKDDGLLAHLPKDMKYFRETTNSRTVVMGRRTLESFPGGKFLESHVSMVLSRSESCSLEGVWVYHRAKDVLEVLRDRNENDVLIIGEDIIYKEFLPYCSKAYVTYIYRTSKVDTDFENLDQDENWELGSVSNDREHEDISFEFRIYRRVG